MMAHALRTGAQRGERLFARHRGFVCEVARPCCNGNVDEAIGIRQRRRDARINKTQLNEVPT